MLNLMLIKKAGNLDNLSKMFRPKPQDLPKKQRISWAKNLKKQKISWEKNHRKPRISWEKNLRKPRITWEKNLTKPKTTQTKEEEKI